MCCIVIIDMANTIPTIVAIACNADGPLLERHFSTFVLNSPPIFISKYCNHNHASNKNHAAKNCWSTLDYSYVFEVYN